MDRRRTKEGSGTHLDGEAVCGYAAVVLLSNPRVVLLNMWCTEIQATPFHWNTCPIALCLLETLEQPEKYTVA